MAALLAEDVMRRVGSKMKYLGGACQGAATRAKQAGKRFKHDINALSFLQLGGGELIR
jgi:hypothetical protein